MTPSIRPRVTGSRALGLSACALLVSGFALGCGPAETGNGGGSGGAGNPGTGGRAATGSGGSNTPGSGGSVNPGSGGSGNPGSGGSANPGSGGSGNPGSGGSANPGSGGSGNPGSGGSVTPGSGGSGMTGSGGGSGANPPGYRVSGAWRGCVWTGKDILPNTTTRIEPADFVTHTAGAPYRVTGEVFANYDAVALLGFNIAEPAAGASCTSKPVDMTMPGPPGVTFAASSLGIAVNFSKALGSQFRIQIQGPNGHRDANDRWCYNIAQASGKAFAPFNMFTTACWAPGTGTVYDRAKPISAIVFMVPGALTAQRFDFTINGFVAGMTAADAPDGGTIGPITGSIGGAGAMDIDYARVKVMKGNKEYIVQNNNWGNWMGTNQTLMYTDNSFTISQATGGSPGAGIPASFPSIFIGGNGDTANGSYHTRSTDSLPKVLSTIQRINSTLRYTGGAAPRNFNVSYDIWFASNPPLIRYNDGISGFVMVWLYKPTQNQPIGSIVRQASINNQMYDVWVGPRGGGASNANAPVVSYVARTAATSFNGDLMPFIRDAGTNGINQSWYLTDVFGGFEIWDGAGTQGLTLQEFTAVVE